MALKKSLQKVIYFSNQKVKDFLDNYLRDESEMTSSSISYLMETHILNDILSGNKEINQKIFDLYSSSDRETMERVMEGIYSIFAAGIMGKKTCEQMRDLVSYHYVDVVIRPYNNIIETDDINDKDYVDAREYYFLSIQRFIDTLKAYLDMNPDFKENDYMDYLKMEQDIHELEHIKECDGDNDKVIYGDSLHFIFGIILKYWDIINNYTYTYRLLVSICRVHTWNVDAETRLKLVGILKKLSIVWDEK